MSEYRAEPHAGIIVQFYRLATAMSTGAWLAGVVQVVGMWSGHVVVSMFNCK